MAAGMDRRRTLIALAALAAWRPAHAAARARHVTSLEPVDSCEPTDKGVVPALRQALAQLGLAPITFESHCFGNDFARAAAIARDAVRRGTGVIAAAGTPTALMVRGISGSVPVMAIVGDPVSAGLTRDLRRPEGNMTGFSNSRPETPAKIVELARSIMPGLQGLVFVGDAHYPQARVLLGPLEPAARAARVAHQIRLVDAAGWEALFASLKPRSVAYIQHASADGAQVAATALRHRVATIADDRGYVEHGGLMGYSVRTANISVRQATMLDKLLRGVAPADIPWELPDDVELSVNLRTAKALGLAIPSDLLLRADRVIQ